MALSENLAVLQYLDACPGIPGHNKIPLHFTPAQDTERNNVLSFDDELGLVEALTVPLSLSDDPKSSAVCVEEHNDGLGMTILFATELESGNKIQKSLECMTEHMQIIAYAGTRILIDGAVCMTTHAELDFSETAEDDLLRDVIRLKQEWLLACLGSSRTRAHLLVRKKSQTIELFDRALHSLSMIVLEDATKLVELHKDFSIMIEGFRRLESAINSEITHNSLYQIVKASHNLIRELTFEKPAGNFSQIFQDIVEKNRLKKTLEKLSQCVEFVRYIRYFAPKYQALLSNVQVRQIRGLPKSYHAFESTLVDNGVISRAISKGKELVQVKILNSLRRRDRTQRGRAAQNILEEDIVPVIRRKKNVHPEMMLLTYYECLDQYSNIVVSPRVIRSSKHSCYLCNLFLETHGRFFCPSTSGRIYFTWKIPPPAELDMDGDAIAKFASMVNEFNNRVEKRIHRSLANQPRATYIESEEFVFFSPLNPGHPRTQAVAPEASFRNLTIVEEEDDEDEEQEQEIFTNSTELPLSRTFGEPDLRQARRASLTISEAMSEERQRRTHEDLWFVETYR